MATLNSKTIGPTGDYATLAAWFAACPANLTTADAAGYVYQGLVQNTELLDSFAITGIAGVDASHYIELTAAPGASFVDNANARTNALRYNAANGAAIRYNSDYGPAIAVSVSYTRISKLQIAGTGTTASAALAASGTIDYVDLNQCVIEGNTAGITAAIIGEHSTARNCVVVARNATPATILSLGYGADAYNCTAVSLGGTATNAIEASYGTTTLKNVFVGGATNATAGNSTLTKTNCFTSIAGPPAGWSAAALSTATFESVTNGTHDFRLKAGSALIDAGATESTYAANDITGLARSGSWDVGAWEVASAGGTDGNAPGGTGTSTGSGSGGTATGGAGGTGTITIPAIKDLTTGTLRSSQTGITVIVNDLTTGALVVKKTAQTTDTGGNCAVADALLVAATTYRVTTILADGSEGTWKYAAA